MVASELINHSIQALPIQNSIQQALTFAEEEKLNMVPLINNEKFVGLVSESALLDKEFDAATIQECADNFKLVHCNGSQPIFDVVQLIVEHKLDCIGVIDEENNYLGIITRSDLLTAIGQMPLVENPGGILVLHIHHQDFHLSEVARIAESEDAKILGSLVTRFPDSNTLELTLKLNKPDIQSIVQSFERFNYTVVAHYDKSTYTDDLQDRYNSLMKYLNI